MQTLQKSFRTPDQLLTSLPALGDFQPDVLLVFASPDWFASSPPGVAPLLEAFPGRCVGCSTAGEIASAEVLDGNCVVTALRFATSRARILETPLVHAADSREAGLRLGALCAAAPVDGVIVLSPGTNVDGSALVDGLRSALPPGTPLSGGLAGDGPHFRQTWTIGPTGVHPDRVVALALAGPRLTVSHGCYGGWKPFGPARQITACEGNVLLELDGEPALAVYRRYLGDYARDLPAAGLLFPFAILDQDQDETGLIRTIIGIDDQRGSLVLAGSVHSGSLLRLMHTNPEGLVDGAEQAAETAFGSPAGQGAQLALLITCVGRKLVMGDRVDDEVEAVIRAGTQPGPTVTGYYSYGEIIPASREVGCQLHNQTMTITLLGERAG